MLAARLWAGTCYCAEGKPSPLAEEDKAAVRDVMLEGVTRAPHAVRVQVRGETFCCRCWFCCSEALHCCPRFCRRLLLQHCRLQSVHRRSCAGGVPYVPPLLPPPPPRSLTRCAAPPFPARLPAHPSPAAGRVRAQPGVHRLSRAVADAAAAGRGVPHQPGAAAERRQPLLCAARRCAWFWSAAGQRRA